jgi:hypothetical protein
MHFPDHNSGGVQICHELSGKLRRQRLHPDAQVRPTYSTFLKKLSCPFHPYRLLWQSAPDALFLRSDGSRSCRSTRPPQDQCPHLATEIPGNHRALGLEQEVDVFLHFAK